jgi:hypothetical protein
METSVTIADGQSIDVQISADDGGDGATVEVEPAAQS